MTGTKIKLIVHSRLGIGSHSSYYNLLEDLHGRILTSYTCKYSIESEKAIDKGQDSRIQTAKSS